VHDKVNAAAVRSSEPLGGIGAKRLHAGFIYAFSEMRVILLARYNNFYHRFFSEGGETMRYLVLVCLSLALGGCSSAGPYGGLRSYAGLATVDLGACAVSPIRPGHEDKLCTRQNGYPN
jgi:hypothetical protein